MAVYPYRKTDQISKYILQILRVFSGFQVQDGVVRNGTIKTKRVPVTYGGMSRIVASLISKGDYLTNNSIPIMAVNVTGLELDPNNKRTHRQADQRVVNKGSDLPVKVVNRLSGVPLILNFELSIYASSITEMYELLEQILLIFNPRVVIQKSTDIVDSEYITDVTLEAISNDIQYPMGTDSRLVMQTLSFSAPIRISYPYGETDNVIETITANVKDTNNVDMIDTIIGGTP